MSKLCMGRETSHFTHFVETECVEQLERLSSGMASSSLESCSAALTKVSIVVMSCRVELAEADRKGPHDTTRYLWSWCWCLCPGRVCAIMCCCGYLFEAACSLFELLSTCCVTVLEVALESRASLSKNIIRRSFTPLLLVGNDTTTVELVMFTTEVPAPSSALSLWHGVEQSGELNGLILSVLVEFTWNRLEFCEDRRCMVEAWLTSWSADLPTVFLCLAEQGERIFVDKFRSNGELNNVVEADIELPNEFPYVVTVVLSHNATPNSTSALMRVNQEVLYQGLAMDGDLYAYPSGAFRTFESSPLTALATLLVAVFGMRKVLATM